MNKKEIQEEIEMLKDMIATETKEKDKKIYENQLKDMESQLAELEKSEKKESKKEEAEEKKPSKKISVEVKKKEKAAAKKDEAKPAVKKEKISLDVKKKVKAGVTKAKVIVKKVETPLKKEKVKPVPKKEEKTKTVAKKEEKPAKTGKTIEKSKTVEVDGVEYKKGSKELCEKLESRLLENRSKAKKAAKKVHPKTQSQKIGSAIADAAEKAVKAIPVATIKKDPKAAAVKFNRIEKAGNEFINAIYDILRTTMNKSEAKKEFEKFDKVIKHIMSKFLVKKK